MNNYWNMIYKINEWKLWSCFWNYLHIETTSQYNDVTMCIIRYCSMELKWLCNSIKGFFISSYPWQCNFDNASGQSKSMFIDSFTLQNWPQYHWIDRIFRYWFLKYKTKSICIMIFTEKIHAIFKPKKVCHSFFSLMCCINML